MYIKEKTDRIKLVAVQFAYTFLYYAFIPEFNLG